MTNIERMQADYAESRRISVIHAKARVQEIQRMMLDISEQVALERLDQVKLSDLVRAVDMLRQTCQRDQVYSEVEQDLRKLVR